MQAIYFYYLIIIWLKYIAAEKNLNITLTLLSLKFRISSKKVKIFIILLWNKPRWSSLAYHWAWVLSSQTPLRLLVRVVGEWSPCIVVKSCWESQLESLVTSILALHLFDTRVNMLSKIIIRECQNLSGTCTWHRDVFIFKKGEGAFSLKSGW